MQLVVENHCLAALSGLPSCELEGTVEVEVVFPGWIVVVLPSWTGLSGRFVEEEGRGRLGKVDERKETRGQVDGRGGPALRADGASWDEC